MASTPATSARVTHTSRSGRRCLASGRFRDPNNAEKSIKAPNTKKRRVDSDVEGAEEGEHAPSGSAGVSSSSPLAQSLGDICEENEEREEQDEEYRPWQLGAEDESERDEPDGESGLDLAEEGLEIHELPVTEDDDGLSPEGLEPEPEATTEPVMAIKSPKRSRKAPRRKIRRRVLSQSESRGIATDS